MSRTARIAMSLLLLVALAGFAPRGDLDAIAEAYVRLVLRVAQHDKAYLDAWFGPSEWTEAAKAAPGTLPELEAEAARLADQAAAVRPGARETRRRAFLLSQLGAVRAKLQVMQGTTSSTTAARPQALYGVTSRAEAGRRRSTPTSASSRRSLPGKEPLHARIAAYRARFAVPKDRLEAVVRAAVAECRRRTVQHIALPEGEGVEIEMVSGKPWAAYNWYRGDGRSLIQVNTDYPLQIERVLELGCHEAYPGHHLHNTLLEQRLVNGNGWVEFQIYPLSTPFFFTAEGIGDYVPELVFPHDERVAFARKTLFPLAGLDPAEAERYFSLGRAVKRLSAASMSITADYVDGRIDRGTAVGLTQKYALLSREQAEASVELMPKFRSYGVNYGLGREMVRARIERAGPDPAAKWKALERLLSEPVTPADLRP